MNLDERLSGTFPLDGREVPFVLSLATVARTMVRIYDPVRRPNNELALPLRTMVLVELSSIDGRVVKQPMVERIVTDPHALGAVLRKRNDFYEWARLQGKLFARCPHCREREADWTLFGLGVGLRAAMPELFRPDGVFLAVPPLSRQCALGRRPAGVALAADLRFELPSHLIGLADAKRPTGGLTAPIDIERERTQWERWLPPGVDDAEGRSWWRPDDLGFRAVLRVASAIAKLDRGGPPSPEKLMLWPAIDFFFLSALRVMTHFVDVPPESSLVYTCVCGGRYLPLG